MSGIDPSLTSNPTDPIDLFLARAVEGVEQSWKAGRAPDLLQHLDFPGLSATQRQLILDELVCVDLEWRWSGAWRQPSSPTTNGTAAHDPRRWLLEQYLERYAELGPADRLPVEVIRQEYEERCKCDDVPAVADYLLRFPAQSPLLLPALERASAEIEKPIPLARGRYRIIGPPLDGGLGRVWPAHDEKLGRTVALKEILPDFRRSPDARRRLAHEAQLTAQLDHPGIVAVHDMGSDPQSGEPFYVMRLVKGRTLTEAARRYQESSGGALELSLLLNKLIAVCDTVSYAHVQGVIHRDLKGANILVGEFGEVVVLDWGLAARLQLDRVDASKTASAATQTCRTSDHVTLDGEKVGTPRYMSPEQTRGDHAAVGPRSDVYSLGAILHEILTGARPPPVARAVKDRLERRRALRLASGRRTRRRSVRPAIPTPLAAVCAKAMAHDPPDRYSDAGEFAQDLRRWLANDPVSAWREPFGERLLRRARRHRRQLPWVAALFVAVIIGVIIVNGALSHAGKVAAQRDAAEARASLATQSAQVQEHARVIREHLLNTGRGGTWKAWQTLEAMAGLKVPIGDTTELRTIGAASLTTVDMRSVQTLCQGLNARCLAFSPDGRRLAVGKHKGQAYWVDVVDAASGQRVAIYNIFESAFARTRETGISSLIFTEDGRWLVAGTRSGKIYAWDTTSAGAPRLEWPVHTKTVGDLAMVPGSSVALSCSEDGTVKAIDLAHAGKVVCAVDLGGPGSDVTCSPDGRLVIAAGDRGIRAFTADFAQASPSFRPLWSGDGNYRKVRISADGRSVAASRDKSIVLLDPATGGAQTAEMRDPTLGVAHQEEIHHLEFNADGSLLVSGSGDRRLKLWDTSNGALLASSVVRGTGNVFPSFSPDGRYLASTDYNRVVLYEIGGVEAQSVVARHAYPIRAVRLDAAAERKELVCVSQKRQLYGARPAEVTQWTLPDFRLERSLPVAGSAYDEQPLALFNIAYHSGNDSMAYAVEGMSSVATHAAARPLAERASGYVELAYSPDGESLWTITDDTLSAWETANVRLARRWTNVISDLVSGNSGLRCLAVGSRRVIVGARDGKVRVFDAHDISRPLCESPFGMLSEKVPVHSVAITPDESIAIAGKQDGEVQVIRVADGEPVSRLVAHRDSVDSVSVSPDAKLVATGSGDGEIHLWTIANGQLIKLLTLKTATGVPVSSVEFSADGTLLMVLVQNETAVRVFHLDRLRRRLSQVGLDW